MRERLQVIRNPEKERIHQQCIGRALQKTAFVALAGVALLTLMMCGEFTSTDKTSYTKAWLNGILGGYAWMAFWAGGLLKATKRWKQVVCAALLLGGASLFILSAIVEIASTR